MPVPAPSAHYRPRGDVKAFQAERDGMFALRNERGEVTDRVPVFAREWLVVDGGQASTYAAGEFEHAFDPIPGSQGAFAPRLPARELRQPVEAGEASRFAAELLRCTAAGDILCPADLPIGTQAAMLGEARDHEGARPHIAVLRALRDHAASQPIFDPSVQADVHFFDLMAAEFDPEPTEAQREEFAPGLRPGDIPALVGEMAAANGLQAPAWIVMGDMPGAGTRQMRSLRERMLGGLTAVPLVEVRCAFQPHTEGVNALERFVDFLKARAEHRPLDRQPDFSNLAPGYVPRADRFAAEGVEFMVVEDFVGLYAYAWPDAAPMPTVSPPGL